MATISLQGFTINLPAAPTYQGPVSSPTSVQTVASTLVDVSSDAAVATGASSTGIAASPGGATTVLVQFQWVCLQSVTNTTATENSGTTSVTSGVTSTDTETEEFATSIGMSATASYGAIAAEINASFTQTQSMSTSVALETATTASTTYNVNANSTAQIWQLYQYLVSQQNGVAGATPQTITQQLNYFVTLSS